VVAARTGMCRWARLTDGGRRPVVLSYHSVSPGGEAPDYASPAISIPRPAFRAHLERLARRYRILALDDLLDLRAAGSPPPRGAVVLTLDDGYADNVEQALPELLSVGVPATVFVTTAPMMRRAPLWTAELARVLARSRRGRVELFGRSWGLAIETDRWQLRRGLTREWAARAPVEVLQELAALSERLDVEPGQADDVIMDADAARRWAAAGMALGAHTAHHPNLAYQVAGVVRDELSRSRHDLVEVTGVAPRAMAYPNCGNLARHHDARVAATVAEQGYEAAVTSDPGPVELSADLFVMPRISVSPRLRNPDVLETAIERVRLAGTLRAS